MPRIRLPVVHPYGKKEGEDLLSGEFHPRGPWSLNTMAYDINGRACLTQRPPIQTVEDASSEGAGNGAISLAVWYASNNSTYIVNNGIVYRDSYANNLGNLGNIAQVSMYENDTHVLILSTANTVGLWQVDKLTDVITQVVDPDFPVGLAKGLVVLDGFVFVLQSAGATVFHSDLDDALSWSALATVVAEREASRGVCIEKHHDHIVVFTERTIEFFYNAANPTGSVLARRQDLMYNTGIGFVVPAVDRIEDTIYFIGNVGDNRGVYRLKDFRLEKISNSYVDVFLTEGVNIELNAFSCAGREWVSIRPNFTTVLGPAGTNRSLVYDVDKNHWGQVWQFPGNLFISEVTLNSNFGFFAGVLNNGDTFSWDTITRFRGQDVDVNSNGINISMEMYTELFDADNSLGKSQMRLDLVAQASDNVGATQNFTLRWSDDDYETFTTGKVVNLLGKRRTNRGGLFNRRAYLIEYSDIDKVWVEALDLYYKQHHN